MVYIDGKNRYYTSETDDFLETPINEKTVVNNDYKYLKKSRLARFGDWLLYHFLAVPYFVAHKNCRRIKVVGKENLKELKRTGFIFYGNHSQMLDPFLIAACIAPRRIHCVTHKTAVAVPVAKYLTKSLGAIPVAETVSGVRNMNEAIKYLASEKKRVIVVYPEAHMWSYYAGVREFPESSFKFAVSAGVPAVPFALTYKKRVTKRGKEKKPRITIHIGKPIWVDNSLSKNENAKIMHDMCYEFMKEKCSIEDNYSYYNYIKVTEEEIKKLTNKNT